ncbi:unnamed protein product [Chironomus riparius]|uniref:DNA 3'-5' helicase n=1 Tax=Chironomus riparius TaxID=315576 RepID=A0A9N9S1J8_9DIPT|nr:unnamed protein product [Chironomus riparius]
MEVVEDIHEHPSEDHLKILKSNFQIDNFKEEQWKAISQLMYKKEDVFISTRSGYGKSLIYQFPPVFLGKKAIVISPLISLMETQVQMLKSLGISACFISGQQKNIGLNLENYTVIYSTPENFAVIRGIIKWAADNDEICLIAIDEVHCISKSSSDHRPAYALLKCIKNNFPTIPIVALTSTASKDTTADICNVLSLKSPLMIQVPLDRPNIEYTCIPQTNCFISDVKRYILDLPMGSGVIVYCFKRADTQNYSDILTREGFPSKPYHAGLVEEIRRETLRDFMNGRLNYIVTTNAFGMGVDRPNVRVVIHYGIPKNPETYYVESGRAGRDELPAKSVIFWSEKDYKFHNFCFKENNKKKPFSNQNFNNCQIQLAKMQKYSTVTRCRRATLLSYLEEFIPSVVTESCCDNCLRTLHQAVGLKNMYKEIYSNDQIDVTNDVRMILNLINSYQGKCKHEMLVDFITGTMPTEFNPKHPVEYFSWGASKSKNWWSSILKIVKKKLFVDRYTAVRSNENIIELWGGITRDDYVRITQKGIRFMRLKSKKLICEAKSDFLQSLTKTETEYYIIDGIVHEKPRFKDTKVFDFSALETSLNKSSPRKRLASESDISEVSLTELFKSPFKDDNVSPASPKLQKMSESSTDENKPCCSHWNKNVDKEMNGDKEQKEGQRCEEPNLNNIDLKTCKIVVPLIRMNGGFDPASSSSDKTDKSVN